MKKWFPMADIMVLRRHILWNNYGGQQMRRSYSDRAAGHIGGESDLGLSPLLFPHYFRIIFLLFPNQSPTIAILFENHTKPDYISWKQLGIHGGSEKGSSHIVWENGALAYNTWRFYQRWWLIYAISDINQSDDDSQMIWGCLNMWCAPKQRFYRRNDELGIRNYQIWRFPLNFHLLLQIHVDGVIL